MADSTALHLGPFLISLALSAILYGCALVQTHVYYKLFPKDSWKLRTLVAFEMSFQTVHLAFLLLGVWQKVMTDDAQQPQILGFLQATTVGVVFIAPIAFGAQAFFVFRLYTFSHKKTLPIFCSFLVITQFVFTLIVSIFTLVNRELSLQPWHWFIVLMLFITICADTTIAVSMSYHLKASKSGFARTSRVIDRMVLYIMATGIIPSISALASGISFLVAPDAYIWLGLIIIESGLYTNSLLAALNARTQFSRELQCPGSANALEVPLSRIVILDNRAPSQSQGQTVVLTSP